jgi:hypothetical protein
MEVSEPASPARRRPWCRGAGRGAAAGSAAGACIRRPAATAAGFARQALLAFCCVAAGNGAAADATPPNPLHRTLEQLYAKYLSGGRGNAEIHLSTAGGTASARTRPNGDGSFTCHVFGLRPPGDNVEPHHALLLLAGVLLHEATHCQVTPYAMDLRPDADDPAAQAAASLVLLTLESISDARAVIELHRRDGAEAAQEFAAMMMPRRLMAGRLGHSTAGALRAALQLVSSEPQAVAGDEDAFVAAVRVGRASADQTFLRYARQTGYDQALATPAFQDIATGLDAALERAIQAFRSGRYENNAATLRISDEAASAGDYHFFVGRDGSTRTEPAVGAEGARGLGPLKALMASSQAPEHLLAVQWLEREGLLEAATLTQARGAFARLIQAFTDGTPGRTQRAASIITQALRKSRRGEGLSAVLESAADALKDDAADASASGSLHQPP